MRYIRLNFWSEGELEKTKFINLDLMDWLEYSRDSTSIRIFFKTMGFYGKSKRFQDIEFSLFLDSNLKIFDIELEDGKQFPL
jgi:hypothetical protein